LSALPRFLTVRVGSVRIGVIHGDPTSIAGWGFAVESVPPPGTTSEKIARWFRAARVRGFACTHTCLPYMQDFAVDGTRRLVANNGAAGMPNVRDDGRGVLTRISTSPVPFGRLYGTQVQGVHWDALGVPCTPPVWIRWFEETWPPGSPAWVSYHDRIVDGPSHRIADAVRLEERASDSVESSACGA
ncbi:MAG: metallophosphoesterase, partial [Salinibacter sp.]